jgi:hypothetical protein
MFAASIALGEVLVAHRRFLFYALAPILYTTGIIVGTGPVRRPLRDRCIGLGRGRRRDGAPGGPGDRTRRTTFRIRPAFAVRTAAFREVRSPDGSAHVLGRHRPADDHLLHTCGGRARGRGGFGAQLRARLPGASGQPDRRLLLAGGLSAPVAAYADSDRSTFRSILVRNLVTIGILTALPAVALFVLSGTLVHVLLGGGKFTAEDVAVTSAVVAAFALSVPFDALAYPLSRGLYATHDTLRQVLASFAGLGAVVLAPRCSSRSSGSSASRSAMPPG